MIILIDDVRLNSLTIYFNDYSAFSISNISKRAVVSLQQTNIVGHLSSETTQNKQRKT